MGCTLRHCQSGVLLWLTTAFLVSSPLAYIPVPLSSKNRKKKTLPLYPPEQWGSTWMYFPLAHWAAPQSPPRLEPKASQVWWGLGPERRQSRKVSTEQAWPLLVQMNTQWWMQWRQNQYRAYGIRNVSDCRQGPASEEPRAPAAPRERGVHVMFLRAHS